MLEWPEAGAIRWHHRPYSQSDWCLVRKRVANAIARQI